LLAATAAGVSGVVFAVTGQGVASLVVQSLVQGGIALVFVWRAVPWRPGISVTSTAMREIGRFTVAITAIEVLTFLSRRSDDLMVGAFLGVTALGYYTVGYRILLYAIELLTATISAVALPAFARLQDDRPAMRRAFYRATRLSAAIAVPCFAGMAVLAGRIVPLAFGPQWRPAVPVMQVLAIVGILQSVTYFDRSALIAAGATRREFVLTLVATIGNVVAFAIAVRFGIVAVAVSFLIRNYTFWPIRIRALVDVVGLSASTYLRQYVAPVLASLAMVGVVAWAESRVGANWLDLLALVALGVAVYAAAAAVFSRSLVRELAAMAIHLVPSLARRPA
jgi:PST family polysaccharide transporter